MKKIKIFKTILILSICFLINIPMYCSVQVSEASSFITKSEFNALVGDAINVLNQLQINLDSEIKTDIDKYMSALGVSSVSNNMWANKTNVSFSNTGFSGLAPQSGNLSAANTENGTTYNIRTLNIINSAPKDGLLVFDLQYSANTTDITKSFWGYKITDTQIISSEHDQAVKNSINSTINNFNSFPLETNDAERSIMSSGPINWRIDNNGSKEFTRICNTYSSSSWFDTDTGRMQADRYMSLVLDVDMVNGGTAHSVVIGQCNGKTISNYTEKIKSFNSSLFFPLPTSNKPIIVPIQIFVSKGQGVVLNLRENIKFIPYSLSINNNCTVSCQYDLKVDIPLYYGYNYSYQSRVKQLHNNNPEYFPYWDTATDWNKYRYVRTYTDNGLKFSNFNVNVNASNLGSASIATLPSSLSAGLNVTVKNAAIYS